MLINFSLLIRLLVYSRLLEFKSWGESKVTCEFLTVWGWGGVPVSPALRAMLEAESEGKCRRSWQESTLHVPGTASTTHLAHLHNKVHSTELSVFRTSQERLK